MANLKFLIMPATESTAWQPPKDKEEQPPEAETENPSSFVRRACADPHVCANFSPSNPTSHLKSAVLSTSYKCN